MNLHEERARTLNASVHGWLIDLLHIVDCDGSSWNWLRTESGKSGIPGGAAIFARYQKFRSDLPEICAELKLDVADLTFADFSYTIARWLDTHQS